MVVQVWCAPVECVYDENKDGTAVDLLELISAGPDFR